MGNIIGTTSGSILNGAAGADVIMGLVGDDTIDGGAGDDLITDAGGQHSVLIGGTGNDTICYINEPLNSTQQWFITTTLIDAGDGNDLVDFNSSRFGSVSIALGTGDDLLRFDRLVHDGAWGTQPYAITTGSGRDVIRPGFDFGNLLRGELGFVPLVVTDFTTGNAGDVLDFGETVRGFFSSPTALTVFPATNPFASGHLSLLQIGADTIVRLDYDGSGPGQGDPYWRDLFRLVGVSATQLTAANFAGWDPLGGNASPINLTGTSGADRLFASAIGGTVDGLAGDDWLLGNAASDILIGGAGNDRLDGNGSDDQLDGGVGNDILTGGDGNDVLIGGDGNDTIGDSAGTDAIDGGMGDDLIDLVRSKVLSDGPLVVDTIAINAGDGNDIVHLTQEEIYDSSFRNALIVATIDLGAGDDVLEIKLKESSFAPNFHPSFQATLGAGHDIVRLSSVLSPGLDLTFHSVITDFAAGNGGDQLDVAKLLALNGPWDRIGNPFANGLLRLVQTTEGTRVYFDYDGVDGSDEWNPIVLLQGVNAASLTAWNFMGYAPDRSAVIGVSFSGTSGADILYGTNGVDQIDGLGGNDILSGGFGNDTLNGGLGDDQLSGGDGDDSLFGGDDNDTLVDDFSGSDTLDGGNGDDSITVTRGYTPKDETIIVRAGSGNDTLYLYPNAGSGHTTTVSADMGDGNDRVNFDAFPLGGTNLTLGTGQDTVVLNPNMATQLNGTLFITDFQTGNNGDILDWAGFARTRIQSTPFISVWDNDGRDAYNPFFADNVYSFQPDFRLVQVGSDVQLLVNGISQPLVVFQNTSLSQFTAYNVGFDPLLPTVAPFTQATSYTGTIGRDIVTGSSSNDQLDGADGDDIIDGGNGNDILSGGNGNDSLLGSAGNDSLFGGAGNDALYGGAGHDQLDGGADNDTIYIDRFDTVNGGAGDDRLFLAFSAWDSQTTQYADSYIGSLSAGDGNDLVVMSHNATVPAPQRLIIDLGNGDDTLQGELRDVSVTLGAGRDRIVTKGPFDFVVTDFTPGDNGDIFDFSESIDSSVNATVTLVQSGGDTVLTVHGYYSVTTARFLHTSVSQFTAANFVGAMPNTSSPSSLTLASSLTIANGQTLNIVDPDIQNAGIFAFNTASPQFQFINHGTVMIDGANVSGFLGANGSLFHNAADGVFSVTSQGDAVGVSASYLPFENDGLLEVSTSGGYFPPGYNATGVLAGYSNNGYITNRGTISVSGSGSSVRATGIDAYQIPVDNSGIITVSAWDYAVGVHIPYLTGQTVINSGTITATLTDPNSPFASAGFLFEANSATQQNPGRIVNSGTITADFAVFSQDVSPGGNPEVLNNSGTINGAVFMGPGNDIITNSGTTSGRTMLDEGDDLYDGRQGTHSGTIEGGLGNDILLGGAQAEVLFGDDGSDQIDGGDGDDWLEGGMGGDTLNGGAGFDAASWFESGQPVLVDITRGIALSVRDTDTLVSIEDAVGSQGDDTLYGSNIGNILMGVGGNDHIMGRDGDDVIIGGTGDDMLSAGLGNDRFYFQPGDGNDIVEDFSTSDHIDIAGYSGWMALVQQGADLRITLSASDSILLRNVSLAGFNQSSVVFNASDPGLYIPVLHSQTLFPKQDFVIATGEVLSLTDTDPIIHANATYRASSTQSTALALNAPQGVDGLGVYNRGVLSFTTDEAAVPTYGIATSIYNPYGGHNHWLVNNAGAQITVVAHNSDAVGAYGIGGIWNAGTISVTSLSGDASAVSSLGNYPYALKPRTFVNTGSIVVDAVVVARGVAIGGSTTSVDVMINSGSIIVHGGDASNGIEHPMSAHPLAVQPRLVNSGIITVTDKTSALDSAGLYLGESSHGEVWNSGTITADYAVRVVGAFSGVNLGYNLSLYNTGTLNGRIHMSNYNDTVLNNGAIYGDVELGGGGDFYDGRGGILAGMLSGDDGSDTLLAGSGAQALDGGFGDDILAGGAGNDLLIGGAGADHFRMGVGFGNDVVADFSIAEGDVIDIMSYMQAQSISQSGTDVIVRFSVSDSLTVRNASVAIITTALHFGISDIPVHSIPVTPGGLPAPQAPSVVLAVVNGTAGSDSLTGSPQSNALNGFAGNDALTGGAGDDYLDGGDGDDILNGGTGIDTMAGGLGNDSYYIDQTSDIIVENTNEGTDTIFSSISYSLRNIGASIENLTLLGSANVNGIGNDLVNVITGNSGNNVFNGGLGNDTLIGGAGNDTFKDDGGVDTMIGGAGDDSYWIDRSSDIIIENANEGVDRVYSPVSYSLHNVSENIENLTLTGSANINSIGNNVNNWIVGNSGNNIINGGAGDDILDGGAGTDTMIGGTGNDIFYVDRVSDMIVENANEGIDTIFSSVSFGLRNISASIENLDLIGNLNINGIGNDLANVITGNSGNNVINGGNGDDTLIGGAGDDTFKDDSGTETMIGGTGNDTYWVDRATDTITELFNEGTDQVFASVSYALRAQSQNIEKLTLVGNSNINGIGNDLANIVTGNSGNNVLNGGNGNDTLIGGSGDDTFSDDNGTETMTGGTGADHFIWSNGQFGGLAYSNADRITDFSSIEGDRIELNRVDADRLMAGDQAFTFIGTSAFTNTAGQLRYTNNGVDTLITGDTNGDGIADFAIKLDGLHTMQSSDFVL